MSEKVEYPMLPQFAHERETAIKRLTHSIPTRGGMISLERLKDVVSAAFDGGVLAGIGKSISVVQDEHHSPEIANGIRGLLGKPDGEVTP